SEDLLPARSEPGVDRAELDLLDRTDAVPQLLVAQLFLLFVLIVVLLGFPFARGARGEQSEQQEEHRSDSTSHAQPPRERASGSGGCKTQANVGADAADAGRVI